ncbi:DNA repair protein RecO [Clostridium botulinum]|uniref:DNA repair protein RecO n=1 Tax=Clostridium botulinum TaxID=1491 RepID=UPI000492491D|nr:DNA repair protein RecO [Clostridium botulinum]MCD3197786.1 DNA repair protein RecO [Clostridium botulinum C/D]MCD3201983.1 DNA repair protein RecO [Clostridium botulinum C/D]MCD3211506.1 DNA repair protein RecO [Clostridium botulinum C/D]MCD3214443.1 DNA repair protein RecO [Clostridium botulinum C/D]MCD3222846.1 DNA repair protein RecO [Clostridium botulinum C/D]
MSIFKTKAIVLKTQDYKENDKLVWLFTEKIGKICAIAKGAKKNKSKFMSSTQAFCFGEYVLFRGKSLYNINEIDIIDSFQDLLKDMDTITYGSYFCELILIALEQEESNRELFKDFIKSFYFIKNKAMDLEILARTFELKLLNATGYGFDFEKCCICGKKINKSNYLSIQYYGGVCSDCTRSNGLNISYGAYAVLKFLYKTSIENAHIISVSNEVKGEIYKVLDMFISQSYSKKPKSLEIFNYLKKE